MSLNKKSLDAYLEEVYNQFVAIKDNDFKQGQEVFKSVFEQIQEKMRGQCNYFKTYSSQVLYGGSVYDGTKTTKLDEFDIDIVIRLPISYDDGQNGIIIENVDPGFVKLKITNAFDNLDKQQDWEKCHRVTRDWRDSEKYLLQSKFRHWLHSIIQRAVNEMGGKATVNGVTYMIWFNESGPAYTLNICNDTYKLNVDLVPVIRFMHPRWPRDYRTINGSQAKEWLVVPKPNKTISNNSLKNRCWRLSFQDNEREMLKGCHNLKKIIRLMKKLRNALDMNAIASYYIKTLFMWKIEKTGKQYWQNKTSLLFRDMLEDFYMAIKDKSIPYFWHKKNNLIENLKPSHQKVYMEKLKAVLDSIQSENVDKTIFALLTPQEIKQFKCNVYQRSLPQLPKIITERSESVSSTVSGQESLGSSQSYSPVDGQQVTLLKAIMEKLDILTQKLENQEERLLKLEMAYKFSEMTNMDRH